MAHRSRVVMTVCSASLVRKARGGAPNIYHFCRRSQTLGGHISVTIGLQTKNSSDLERAAAARSIADEFFVWNPLVCSYRVTEV